MPKRPSNAPPPGTPPPDLVARATRLGRKVAADASTANLRALAEALVSLRQSFTTTDGLPDWGGRTHAYRDAVAGIYASAGIPRDSADNTITSAVRYHVGNVLRETAPAEDLTALGLSSAGSAVRRRASRDRISALARAGAAQDGGRAKADPLKLIAGAEVLLSRVSADALAKLTDPERRAVAVASLEAIATTAASLRGRLGTTSRRGRLRLPRQ